MIEDMVNSDFIIIGFLLTIIYIIAFRPIALNIREVHERPEGMEVTAVMMVGLNIERIHQGLTILANNMHDKVYSMQQVFDYSMPNVSEKVVLIIHIYTDYINRVVWKNIE